MNSMPLGKTPGCDGIPVHFYRYYSDFLGNYLLETLKDSYEKGKLFRSGRRSIYSLIPKKDRDMMYMKNWRPITLIQIIRFLAKALTNRMKPYLDELIHSSQTGFMKGRNITYINWILILYEDFESCTINTGYISLWFKPSRGLHQGAPESPMVYLCVVEIMGINIRRNDEIIGIRIGDVTIKSGHFADDTLLFSMFYQSSLEGIVQTLAEFESNTGLKVKVGLGFLTYATKTSLKIRWVVAYFEDEEIKVLANALMQNDFGVQIWHFNKW